MSAYSKEYQRKYREDNKTPGVVYDKRAKKYRAYNTSHKARITGGQHYGFYTHKEDAIEAVRLGRKTNKAAKANQKKHGADIREEGGCLKSINILRMRWGT